MKSSKCFLCSILILILFLIITVLFTSCQLEASAPRQPFEDIFTGQWVEGETNLEQLKEQQEGCRDGQYSWRLIPEEVASEFGHTNEVLAEYFSKEYELMDTAENGKSRYLTYLLEGGRKVTFDLYHPFGSGEFKIYAVKKYKID